MPQISKIRIVNFNYNDGNRFIPDELYDLASDSGEALNSLFNLNNGGGKTVLVQLMMQPVNPKAMAGGRHIEDYFTSQGNHSFVLIEWTTDGSKEKLLTGIAIAASISNSSDENRRGNSIKYYTFKTVYENYSPYSIAALELSKNENGKYVPAAFDYVREKAKTSKGVLEYYSSDESVKWVNELANYGILRSEWESVIEALNKDEGGLNQYFDEAKTSEKLIAKFFIPAIEHKIKSVSNNGGDGSLETILINYAKKISEKETVIQERDTNRRLLITLSELNKMSEQLYSVNDEFISSIGETRGFRAALAKRISAIEAEITSLDCKINEQNNLIAHIEHEEKSKAFYEASDRFNLAVCSFAEAKENLEECKNTLARMRHEEDVLQCAKLYKKVVEAEGEINELKKLIEEKENDSENAERIAVLKYSVLYKAQEKYSVLESKQNEDKIKYEEEDSALTLAKKEMEKAEEFFHRTERQYIEAEVALGETKKGTERLIKLLSIDATRRFDGFFHEEDIEDERTAITEKQRQLKTDIEQLEHVLTELDERKEKIPEEKFELNFEIKELENKKEQALAAATAFDELYKKLRLLCEKYSLEESAIYSGSLRRTIQEEVEMSRAKANKIEQDKEIFEERLTAAQNGYVHILPKIMEYVHSTGISCQTGEEYLCSLVDSNDITVEDVAGILEKYPEVAYSILFDGERELKRFISAGNIDWLPAIVPLLTMEQVFLIINSEMKQTAFLAACDKTYFADKTGYCNRLAKEIAELVNQMERYKLRVSECEDEKEIVQQFDYNDTWRTEQELHIEMLKNKINDLTAKVVDLEAELKSIKEKCNLTKEELEKYRNELQEVNKRLDLFAGLRLNLCEEVKAYNKMQELAERHNNADIAYRKQVNKVKTIEETIGELKDLMEATTKDLADIQDILNQVDGVSEKTVIEGELDILYSQYSTLCDSMSEGLEMLNSKLQAALREKDEIETELFAYRECTHEEYETISFYPNLLEKIRDEIGSLEKKLEELQKIYDECNRQYTVCNEKKENSKCSLEDYGGVALARNEIGENFKNRKNEAKKEISVSKDKKGVLDNEKRTLERTIDKVDSVLVEIEYGELVKAIELSASPERQWDGIRDNFFERKKAYNKMKTEFSNRIRDAIDGYKDITLAEIVGKLNAVRSMLEDVEIKGDRLYTVSESIETMITSIEKINSQIETDLREIENDFNDIVNQCVNQGRRMYQDLRSIARSSRAHIFPGKPQTQMVKMNLPEENEISEEASLIAIRTEIENGADEIKRLLKDGADEKEIQKRAKKIVSSQRLLLRYIKQESIQVKVFKIDMNAENSGYKRWEDTLTQSSGAEKFVVFFAVVLTLMNYTRSSSGLVSKTAKSVLILDNPFGKITSAHLLKPMFDIAKHFNVQLICLSDINKSDVINCFDCVIKLVIKTQNLSNFEIMTHEGNERIEHGYYKVMNGQMSLF